MRASQFFITTLRESPGDAEIISHKLMLRAGLIKKLGAGLYTWLPLGLRVLRKIENIVREEMNQAGALELLMPAVQPAELWKETGRWDTFGAQLLTMHDANQREYCFGPTHEEVITDLMRNMLHSYKQLPINFYQIQTKFRDEIRPRYGVMRAREFLMKDAYSFHLSEESLQETYNIMYQTYCRIIERLGLRFRAVEADTGAIGGSASHEFQVLAEAGEDLIFYSDIGPYAANIEQAASLAPTPSPITNSLPLTLVDTTNYKTVSEVASFLNVPISSTVKTIIVEGENDPLIALIIRGDDVLNEIKACKHPLVKSPLRFASDESITNTLHAPPGSLGPVNLNIPVIVDQYARALPEFICGANIADKHYLHAVWERDAHCDEIWDLRNVKEGDPSPDGIGFLKSCRGIEVGHVFALGKKYADVMHAEVLNLEGKRQTMLMGCYGFGVSRVIGAAIEQHHDERGICWPASIAPFQAVIIPINGKNNIEVQKASENLYQNLLMQGIDVLIDDRTERPGVLFADHDLIGIPHRFVIGERLLALGKIEYKSRISDTSQEISIEEAQKML